MTTATQTTARPTTAAPSLADIEALTTSYAAHRDDLARQCGALQAEIDALMDQHRVDLKRIARRAEAARGALAEAIAARPDLFAKPRTQIWSGLKVGLQKGKGKLDIPDLGRTIALIQKHLPEQVDTLIRYEASPVKDALSLLAAADLKRIGVSVIDGGDAVVITPIEREAESVVRGILTALGSAE